MWSTAQPQSGLATSTRCWSGCMKPRERSCVPLPALPNLLARLSPPWPSLQLTDSQLVYTDPLPKSCRCATQSAKGASVLICSLFWQRCLFDWLCCGCSSSLGDGGWSVLALHIHCQVRLLPLSLRAWALGMKCTCRGLLVGLTRHNSQGHR